MVFERLQLLIEFYVTVRAVLQILYGLLRFGCVFSYFLVICLLYISLILLRCFAGEFSREDSITFIIYSIIYSLTLLLSHFLVDFGISVKKYTFGQQLVAFRCHWVFWVATVCGYFFEGILMKNRRSGNFRSKFAEMKYWIGATEGDVKIKIHFCLFVSKLAPRWNKTMKNAQVNDTACCNVCALHIALLPFQAWLRKGNCEAVGGRFSRNREWSTNRFSAGDFLILGTIL